MHVKRLICTILLFSGMAGHLVAQEAGKAGNYLYEEYRKKGSDAAFKDVTQWREERYRSVMEKIAALPAASKALLLKEADKALSFNWPSLPATLYL